MVFNNQAGFILHIKDTENTILNIEDVDGNGYYDVNDFLDMNNKEILDMNDNKKWDLVLMNPPYDRSLHLKFLEKVIEISDKVVSIQPVRWIQDPTAKYKKTSDYNKFENSILKHIKDLEVINVEDAGSKFNITINSDLGIFICDKNGGYNYEIKNEFPYNLYEKREFPFKIGKYKDNKDKNFVCICSMQGHPHRGIPAYKCTNKYGAFINGKNKEGKTLEEAKKSNPRFTLGNIDEQLIAIFNTGDEAQNFYNMCNTDFWKFICYKSTSSGQVNIKFLPWPNDYSEKWTNEKLYEYFKLSKTEIELVKNTMKDLYKQIELHGNKQ